MNKGSCSVYCYFDFIILDGNSIFRYLKMFGLEVFSFFSNFLVRFRQKNYLFRKTHSYVAICPTACPYAARFYQEPNIAIYSANPCF